MKIAYMLHWNEDVESGVLKKVLTQVQMWSNLGHDVQVYQYSTLTRAQLRLTEDQALRWHVYTYNHRSNRLQAISSAVADILAWAPNIVYFRYDLYYRPLQRLFAKLPVVVEINTNDVIEMRHGGVLRHLYNRLTRNKILSRAKGTVFVTHELAESPAFACIPKTDKFVVPNSISLDQFPHLDTLTSSHPQLVFLGSGGQPWQGVDKILSMATHLPDWTFHVIGVCEEDLQHPTPQNVLMQRRVDREVYEPILSASHVAIGTLALHRKGMNEACPLKVREYLAYGLPVIIAYDDTHFDHPVPFLLKLSNQEDNVQSSLMQIQRFVQQWLHQRVSRDLVRELDATVVESRRVAIFERVVNNVGAQSEGASNEPA